MESAIHSLQTKVRAINDVLCEIDRCWQILCGGGSGGAVYQCQMATTFFSDPCFTTPVRRAASRVLHCLIGCEVEMFVQELDSLLQEEEIVTTDAVCQGVCSLNAPEAVLC